jgi:hypothetical protein
MMRGEKAGDSPENRFWKKVVVRLDTGCWEWNGSKNQGYGQFQVHPKVSIRAHRFSYEMLVGPVPDGKELDHSCRNRSCVNPSHLEPLTHRENTLRGNTIVAANAVKTHCPYGHPLSGDNLIFYKNGSRHCRTCARASSRRVYWADVEKQALRKKQQRQRVKLLLAHLKGGKE